MILSNTIIIDPDVKVAEILKLLNLFNCIGQDKLRYQIYQTNTIGIT